MRALCFLAAVTVLILPSASAALGQPWGVRVSRAELISSCEGCHGRDGQTREISVPRLNGQTREYLMARLKDLRNPSNQTVRAIHNMLAPARGVSEADLAALADHFAAQPPNRPAQGRRGREAGAMLYARGDGARLPSCASCHGDSGQGQGAVPRLAGQHGGYLIDQMEALMLTARSQPGMNRHAQFLRPEQIRNLAAFLGGE